MDGLSSGSFRVVVGNQEKMTLVCFQVDSSPNISVQKCRQHSVCVVFSSVLFSVCCEWGWLYVYINVWKWRKIGGGFKSFLFATLLGGMIQFDEHIFQMGWFNHQLEKGQINQQFLRILAPFLQHFFAEKPHNLRFCQKNTIGFEDFKPWRPSFRNTVDLSARTIHSTWGGREQNQRDFPTSSALTFSRNPGKYFTQYIQSRLKNGISCPQNILVNLATPKTSGGIRISRGQGLAKTPEHSWIAWRITRRKCARIQEYVETQIHINTYVNV